MFKFWTVDIDGWDKRNDGHFQISLWWSVGLRLLSASFHFLLCDKNLHLRRFSGLLKAKLCSRICLHAKWNCFSYKITKMGNEDVYRNKMWWKKTVSMRCVEAALRTLYLGKIKSARRPQRLLRESRKCLTSLLYGRFVKWQNKLGANSSTMQKLLAKNHFRLCSPFQQT